MKTTSRLSSVVLEGALDLSPLARHLHAKKRPFTWMDSSRQLDGLGSKTVLAVVGPTAFSNGRSCRSTDATPDCVDRMRTLFKRDRAKHPFELSRPSGFVGGWVGYLTYEAMIDFDSAFPGRDGLLPFPRIWFQRTEQGVTVDYERETTTIWAWGRPSFAGERVEELQRWLTDDKPPTRPAGNWRVDLDSLDRDWHKESVHDILSRVSSGEIYQANLTSPITVTGNGDSLGLFETLREASPGDFAAYVDWPGLVAVGSSPELFFSIRGNQITARPMKGTRPAGDSEQEQQTYREELSRSEKDRAENLMIVDLLRNDIGRVAETGSVETPSLFSIETYATVIQMTSTVTGLLDGEKDVFSVMAALHPPGSMTGAPKVQATKVIRRLEPNPRGLYSGCFGLIDWNGDADFNVVIRSLIRWRDRWQWAVGGGIVSDSVPSEEWREALQKISGLLSLTEQ